MLPLIFAALAGSTAADAAVAAVRSLELQVAAWNSGNLEQALDAYCNTPKITWISRSGVSHGFDGFAASLRQDFPDPNSMGRFVAQVLHKERISKKAVLLTISWSITREGKRLMGGTSTQLWKPCRGKLRIVLEHAS